MRAHDRFHGTRLSGADRKRLAAALEAAREARVYRRLEALLLVAEGHSVAEATRRCRVDRSSVHRWLAQYLTRRDAAALADQPRRCGYQATSWTVPLLARYLAARNGIAISARTLRRRLHEAGYRWKRPRYVYGQRAAH